MIDHDSPHDGAEEPLPEPELPASGEAVDLAPGAWLGHDEQQQIWASVPGSCRGTWQGVRADGRHEVRVPAMLTVLVDDDGFERLSREVEADGPS